MSKRQFTCLKTNTGELLENGTRIRQDGTPFFGLPMSPIEGVIVKMVECDSGIFLHVRSAVGEIQLAHVQSFLPTGVAMDNQGVKITILNRTQQQLEIRA